MQSLSYSRYVNNVFEIILIPTILLPLIHYFFVSLPVVHALFRSWWDYIVVFIFHIMSLEGIKIHVVYKSISKHFGSILETVSAKFRSGKAMCWSNVVHEDVKYKIHPLKNRCLAMAFDFWGIWSHSHSTMIICLKQLPISILASWMIKDKSPCTHYLL